MATSQLFLSNPPSWTNITCSSVSCQQPVIIDGGSLPPIGTTGQVCALDNTGALIATDSLGAKSATTLTVQTQLNLQGGLQTPLVSGYLTSTAGLVGSATSIPSTDISGLPSFPASAVVGVSDNQVLTTKTIDGNNNTISNISQASVTGLSTALAGKLSTAGGSVTGGIFPTGGGIPLGLSTNRYSNVFTTAIDTNTLTTTIPNGYIKSVSGVLGSSGLTVPVGEVSGLPTFPAGAIVGTTDNQVLTTKSISGTDNTISNISQASVTNLTTDLSARVLKAGDTLTGSLLVNANNTLNLGSNSNAFANVYTQDVILSGSSLTSRLLQDESDIASNTRVTTQLANEICPQPVGNRWQVGLAISAATSVGYRNGVIYVGTPSGGYYSTNGGATYTINNLPGGYVVSDHNGILACAVSTTINQPSYTSADGITWAAGPNVAVAQAGNSANATIRWLGTNFVIITSGLSKLAVSSNGTSWSSIGGFTAVGLSVESAGGTRGIVITAAGSPYYTTNGGFSWTLATGAVNFWCAAWSPAADHVIGIPSTSGAIGAYVSTDGGASWLQSSTAIVPITSTWLTAACYDSATTRLLFIGRDPNFASFIMTSLKDGASKFIGGPQPEGSGNGVVYVLAAFNDGGSASNKLATSKYTTIGYFGTVSTVSNGVGYILPDQTCVGSGDIRSAATISSYLPLTCALENRIATSLTTNPTNISFTLNTLTPIAVATTQDLGGYRFSVNTANGIITYSGPTKNFAVHLTAGGSPTNNQSNQSLSIYARKNALTPRSISRIALANAAIPVGGSSIYYVSLTSGDTISVWGTSTVTMSFNFSEVYVAIRSLYN